MIKVIHIVIHIAPETPSNGDMRRHNMNRHTHSDLWFRQNPSVFIFGSTSWHQWQAA